MRKFTKGQWVACPDQTVGILKDPVSEKMGQGICEVTPTYFKFTVYCDADQTAKEEAQAVEEAQANAQLIASAPELYALAEELANLPDEQCMISPLILEARRLIARIDDTEASHE